MAGNNIVIIGSSGHSSVIIDIIEKESKYSIVGLIDSYKALGEETLGYPVIGKDKDLKDLEKIHRLDGGIIAIGDNWLRYKAHQNILRILPDFNFVTALHPNAQIGKNVTIGKGTVVMGGVVVNPNSKIGNDCILNTKCSLDHECSIGNYSSLAPGVTTGGNVKIGEFTAVSLGANVIHDVNIGNHTIIGAGSLVIKDIPDKSIYSGVPSKLIRKRAKGETYL